MSLRRTLRLLTISALLTSSCLAFAYTAPSNQMVDQAKAKFTQNMISQYNFQPAEINRIMQHIKYNPKVIKAITHPAEKKSWKWYKNFFITDSRVTSGIAYWQAHQKTLQQVQEKYGVDPSVIVSIIGIESAYGRNTGGFNTLNALGTLAFYYPRRAAFFQKELAQFLILTREQQIPTMEMTASYAGALGIPQFMPSSYRHYAVDFSGTKHIDLLHDHDDAIASIGNYLKEAGWIKGQPIASHINNQSAVTPNLVSKNTKPQHSLSWYTSYHIHIANIYPNNPKAALVGLDNFDSKEYWLTFKNFDAIMRYNPRVNYAMAIYQLSDKIKQGYQREQ